MSATGKSVSVRVPSRYSRVRTAVSRLATSGTGCWSLTSMDDGAGRNRRRDDTGFDGIEVDVNGAGPLRA